MFATSTAAGNAPHVVDIGAAAFALSAHASVLARRPDDVSYVVGAIDKLADGVDSIDQWRQRLFVDAGFTGNGAEYHDARNSFLPDVLRRRLGLPITLALVGRLVAERVGLVAWGIGVPGHFLLGIGVPGTDVGDWSSPHSEIVDAFHGGQAMTIDDVEHQFRSMFGVNHRFSIEMMHAVSDDQFLVRMLNNLKSNYARDKNIPGLCAVARMRTCLPGWTLDEGRELVRLLTAEGTLDEATTVLDALVDRFPFNDEVLEDERVRLASRLN